METIAFSIFWIYGALLVAGAALSAGQIGVPRPALTQNFVVVQFVVAMVYLWALLILVVSR